MSGDKTRSASATVAALEALGGQPLIPDDAGKAPAPVITPMPPALVRTNVAGPAPVVGAIYNDAPWRGPAGMIGLTEQFYHVAALTVLADEIGRRLGLPAICIRAVMDTLPGSYVPLLDDWAGWWVIAEAVADKLDLSDPDNPVLPDWIH